MKNTLENNKLAELRPAFTQEPSTYIADDEISLIDLTLVLLHRKVLIGVIFLLCLLLGLTAALLMPRTYTYSTSIETGSQLINGQILPFESTETLSAKISHSFIPLVLNDYQKSMAKDSSLPKITVSIPKKSSIILLETKGTETDGEQLTGLLNSITRKIQDDHARIYQSLKSSLESGLKQAQAMQNAATDLGALEGAAKIESYQSQLANLRETRAILPPMQSNEPTGTSRKLIVIASAMLGLFLAVFAAFGAEFWSKVKEEEKKAK